MISSTTATTTCFELTIYLELYSGGLALSGVDAGEQLVGARLVGRVGRVGRVGSVGRVSSSEQ